MAMMTRLIPMLSAPRLPLWLAAIGVLLTLPALAMGWVADDWVHQAMIQERLPELMGAQPLMDMFRFMEGEPVLNAQMRDLGFLSWWASDTLRASFWRPVTVATHLLDHQLMPGVAWFAHATSIIWGAVLVVTATWVYRRLHGAVVVAGLAALLYAVDDAHAVPVGWVANRSVLLATIAGLAALGAHDRWRGEGWRPGAILAPLALAVGLLAAEAALAATAYLFAYALFLDRGRWQTNLLALWPYAAVVLAWRVVYSSLGYGAASSGLYLDPVREPLRFASAAMERMPVLLASQFTNMPSMLFTFQTRALSLAWVLGALLLLVVLGWLLRDLLRRSPHARFYALGMVLSVLPVCAVFPDNRLLVFVGFGGAGLLAQWLLWLGSSRWLARGLVALHLIMAPVAMVVGVVMMPPLCASLFHVCAEVLPDNAEVVDKTAIFVNSNDLCTSQAHFIRAVQGRLRPARVRLLTSALYDTEVLGIDAHTIEVRPAGGWHSNPADNLLRGADDPMAVGTRLELAGVHIEVMAHNAAGLTSAVRFQFDVPLEDPSLLWFANRDLQLTPFRPPGPGESVHLAAAF